MLLAPSQPYMVQIMLLLETSSRQCYVQRCTSYFSQLTPCNVLGRPSLTAVAPPLHSMILSSFNSTMNKYLFVTWNMRSNTITSVHILLILDQYAIPFDGGVVEFQATGSTAGRGTKGSL